MLAVVATRDALGQVEGPPEELLNEHRNVACTYFNWTDHDRVQGVSLMPDGRILVAGETRSRFDQSTDPAFSGVPTTSYHVWSNGASSGQTDGFVAILSADMTTLEQWAYIGGCDGDRAYYAEADAESIYVVGITNSIRNCGAATFPTTKQYGSSANGTDFDVFLVRFNHTLSQRPDSIVIAGDFDGEENARGSMTLVKNAQNIATAVYLSGMTPSSGFPVVGLTSITPTTQLDHNLDGVKDAFLIRFNVGGTPYIDHSWATFYGGSNDEYAAANVRYHLALDAVFIGGFTNSTNLPLAGSPYDSVLNNGGTQQSPPLTDGFVARFDAATGALEAATYLGGGADDKVGFNDDLELTPSGKVAVAGQTFSTDFPVTMYAHQSAHTNSGASTDVFITVLDSSLSGSPTFSTYLGGSEREEASGLAVDSIGYLYLTGETESDDFDITSDEAFDLDFTNATGTHPGGYADSFIVKVNPGSTHSSRTLKYGSYFSGNTNAATPGTNSNDPPHGARGRSMLYDVSTNTLVLGGQTTTNDLPVTAGVEFVIWRGDEEGFVARHLTD